MFCYETLEFCLENVERILGSTLVFPTYFPSILKIVAWHTFTVFNEFYELLPALISESSFVELFNSILDLPLLTTSLEAQQARKLNEKCKTNTYIYIYLFNNKINLSYKQPPSQQCFATPYIHTHTHTHFF